MTCSRICWWGPRESTGWCSGTACGWGRRCTARWTWTAVWTASGKWKCPCSSSVPRRHCASASGCPPCCTGRWSWRSIGRRSRPLLQPHQGQFNHFITLVDYLIILVTLLLNFITNYLIIYLFFKFYYSIIWFLLIDWIILSNYLII